MQITLELIKELRKKTKCGIMNCRVALEESGGDLKKAEDWLRKKGIKSAEKRTDRLTATGLIEAYSHAEGKIVAIVELLCETDFVARTDDFKKLAHNLAMQVAAMNPGNVKKFLLQPYIRDEKIMVGDLIKELIGKTGENIKVNRIARFALGE